MRVVSAESTELFVGPSDAPLQLVRVAVTGCTEPAPIRIHGDGLAGEAAARPGDDVIEVAVAVESPVVGERRTARVHTPDGPSLAFEFTVAEPGWTMFMISHFHYDPVWWNTQGAYTSQWREDPPGRARQANGFELVRAHLEMARREPEYKFVLAEVDYLKPYWDTHPQDRADLRRFLADGRIEVMGGTYNEPNTNLTSPETTIRNLVHGIGFQRDVLGAEPATAWQLDVFGHDPQFPGLAADAGLTSSSWARGPHHQWGPAQGGVDRMQFCSEFEWIAPSGRGLLTHYMPAHYSAGWSMDSSTSLADAEAATYALFDQLKKVALTRNVLLPVGTDYTPPNKWVTAIHRDWGARYTWPRFVCALPKEFFAAVRAELAKRGWVPSPQTRDMNPIYTGKDVSYIDTKQANRAAENAVLEAERFAVFAALLTGAEYPQAALAKAWVQLAYGAHHDAITGSESDQVYLDLLTGWRDAWELGRAARDNSLRLLSGAVAASHDRVVVWNPLTQRRTDIVTARVDPPLQAGVRVFDPDGAEVAALVEHDGRSVTWLACDVPSLGWRVYRLVPADEAPGWELVPGTDIANEHYRLAVDPERGGALSSLVQDGRQLIAAGRVANELALYEEYPSHPTQGEGPWHLLPTGPVVCSSACPAQVQAYRGPLGQRLVVRGRIGTLLRYTQTLTLWDGVDRVDCRTSIDEFTGEDRLLRLRWPCPVPGAMPISEVGDAVVGRGFALLHEGPESVDTAQHPWTLDNPAYGWFGLSSAVRVRAGDGVRAVSVAEVVSPTETVSGPMARDLMVALVRAGVTATCSGADKPRYGHLDVDSNLPDARIALGGPDRNTFTKAVLAEAAPAYTAELQRQLAKTGTARVWVPAANPLARAWLPGADLRAPCALPVLVIDGRDEKHLRAAVASLADDLADAEIVVHQRAAPQMEPFEDRTVALLNRGVPSFAVDSEGTLHTALMRSCTGWPSGVWIDQPRRTAPDGSNFQLQHWTHHFDYALVCGEHSRRRAAGTVSGPRAAARRRHGGTGRLAPGGRGRVRGHRRRRLRSGGAGLPRRWAGRHRAGRRRPGPAGGDDRQPRSRRAGPGCALDQPLGHLGVDRPARARRRATRPGHGQAGFRCDPAGLAGARAVVGPGSGRLRGSVGLFAGGEGERDMSGRSRLPGSSSRRDAARIVAERVVATVAGVAVAVDEVDAAEARLRDGPRAAALPASGTSEGRQLRRWLTQLIVTERVVAAEAAARGLTAAGAPAEADLLPDATARLEIGSVAAAVLADPLARALFAAVTARVAVTDDAVADYHARNPLRFAAPCPGQHGWRAPAAAAPPLDQVRRAITEHLLGAARRRAFRVWLDARRNALVVLAPGYEHPGDPRQPDNTRRH